MKLLNGKLLIEVVEEKEQTSTGGIILSCVENAKESRATVIATCGEYYDEKTQKIKKSSVSPGDTIFIHKGIGEEVKLNGKTYRMIHEIDVFAKLVK